MITKKQTYDLVVVGGGIYGAWIAFEAQLRGWTTLLVEANDFASKTSSASSKLIHGGFRYLEKFQFSMVRKSLKERSLLRDLAPHRIAVRPLLFPVYKTQRHGRFSISAGMLIYDTLAGAHSPVATHRFLPPEKVLQHYPLLNPTGLTGGFLFGDCAVDDARYTLEIILGAQQAGAEVINYCKATAITLKEGEWQLELQQQLRPQTQKVRATRVALCAGPLVESVLQSNNIAPPPVSYSRGIHIVVDSFTDTTGYFLPTGMDERIFFVLPYYGKTLIGTTDTPVPTVHDESISMEDITYLLRAVNHNFPDLRLTPREVRACFQGIRALYGESGSKLSSISREWQYIECQKNLWASIGGKLTSARADAALAVNKMFQTPADRSKTATRPFPWALQQSVQSYVAQIQNHPAAVHLKKHQLEHLVMRYGNRSQELLGLIEQEPNLAASIETSGAQDVAHLPFLYAECLFAARYEKVQTLTDIIRRRVPIAILQPPDRRIFKKVAEIVAKELHWDKLEIEKQVTQSYDEVVVHGGKHVLREKTI